MSLRKAATHESVLMAGTVSSARCLMAASRLVPPQRLGGAADRPNDQISVCFEVPRASSTSMPSYLRVDSSLWTAVHRLDYLRRRPMSRLRALVGSTAMQLVLRWT